MGRTKSQKNTKPEPCSFVDAHITGLTHNGHCNLFSLVRIIGFIAHKVNGLFLVPALSGYMLQPHPSAYRTRCLRAILPVLRISFRAVQTRRPKVRQDVYVISLKVEAGKDLERPAAFIRFLFLGGYLLQSATPFFDCLGHDTPARRSHFDAWTTQNIISFMARGGRRPPEGTIFSSQRCGGSSERVPTSSTDEMQGTMQPRHFPGSCTWYQFLLAQQKPWR